MKPYDIPAKKHTIACAQMIGANIGKFAVCEEAKMYGVHKSLYFWMDIDVEKPLIWDVKILLDKKLMWIKIGYTKL